MQQYQFNGTNCWLLLTWLFVHAGSVDGLVSGLVGGPRHLSPEKDELNVAPWLNFAVDPYSAASSDTLVAEAHPGAHSTLLRTNVSAVSFFGVDMCFPGYAAPKCSDRLQPANPWYTQDCPNLQDPAGKTFDINTPVTQLGGRVGCGTFTGAEAISPCAYLCFAHPSYGTAMIPNALWKYAQTHEIVWAHSSVDVSDDRSYEHFEGFGSYASIPSKLGPIRLIEVGSGPWTQTKGLLFNRPDLQVSEVTLFEPAAQWYINTCATCSYKTGKLQKFNSSEHHEFPIKIVGAGGELLVSHAIKYDALVVMNVIEHVQNAFSFLSGLHHVLKPGGLLIFHERFHSDPPSADTLLDTGLLHPIRITKQVLDVFLQQFDVLSWNAKPTAGMVWRNLGEQGYYFIGRKKSSP